MRKQRFKRTDEFVVLRPIGAPDGREKAVGSIVTAESLPVYRLRALYRKGSIGAKDTDWTDIRLKRAKTPPKLPKMEQDNEEPYIEKRNGWWYVENVGDGKEHRFKLKREAKANLEGILSGKGLNGEPDEDQDEDDLGGDDEF